MNKYKTLQRALLCVFLLCVAALPSKAGNDANDMFEAYRNIIGTWKVDLSGGASLILVIDERNIKETIKKPGKSDIVNVKNYSVSIENEKMIINTGSSKYFFNSSGLFGWDGTPFVRMTQDKPKAPTTTNTKKNTKPQAESNVTAAETKRKGENNSTKPKNTDAKTESQKKAEKIVEFNNGNGSQNSSGGNANGTDGKPSVGGGLKDGGYTLESFPTDRCIGPGTIIVSVLVRADGTVKYAQVTGGTLQNNNKKSSKGETAAQTCLRLAKGSKFRVPRNTPPDKLQSGTLTYTIR